MVVPTAVELAEAIGLPLAWWRGRCYREVAMALGTGVLSGTFTYGMCAGYDHGWITLGDDFIDPTLWTIAGPGCDTPEVVVVGPEDWRRGAYTVWGTMSAGDPLDELPPNIMECLLEA